MIRLKPKKKLDREFEMPQSLSPEQKLSVVILLRSKKRGKELLSQLSSKKTRVTQKEKKALKEAFQESAAPLIEHLERLKKQDEPITYQCAEYLNSISLTAPVHVIQEISQRDDVESVIPDQPVYAINS